MTILVVDRIPFYRYGTIGFLKDTFPEYTLAESETIRSESQVNPDVVVIRADQENTNDIPGARLRYPTANLIVIGVMAELDVVAGYLNAGVSGFLSIDSELKEFTKCFHDVLEGRRYVSQDIFWLLLDLHDTQKVAKIKKPTPLTVNEYRIARYILEGKKTTWIAAELSRKASTISTIKSNIFRKLSVSNVFQLKSTLESQDIDFGVYDRRVALLK
ncbi:hypothetical protein DSL64_26745 [Dyadobacter luteus]|uniref:HTH luxR-type domain-containing protein n=1 Tax=Dyadobacter luteus TaxID=2259619 RepID=A0A3D8Y397_9BACT|nr:response regulator transcription factor [Dyadobacter luteus]REA56519.1 hypothetical protein DSL64_26745 [Dyadobacter luteus]